MGQRKLTIINNLTGIRRCGVKTRLITTTQEVSGDLGTLGVTQQDYLGVGTAWYVLGDHLSEITKALRLGVDIGTKESGV